MTEIDQGLALWVFRDYCQ